MYIQQMFGSISSLAILPILAEDLPYEPAALLVSITLAIFDTTVSSETVADSDHKAFLLVHCLLLFTGICCHSIGGRKYTAI